MGEGRRVKGDRHMAKDMRRSPIALRLSPFALRYAPISTKLAHEAGNAVFGLAIIFSFASRKAAE